jgi:aerobic-type carbon monoxide dehydrogenase small subunit (CoxS/CutS family)
MIRTVSFTLNGQLQRLTVDDARKLLWVLRTDLGLTGTKFGCGDGLCGTCTVVVGKRAVRACQVSVGAIAGKDVHSIEGLGQLDKLHPLQEAFVAHQAFQCGFCTPGMLMAAYGLLLNVPNPTAGDIVEHLDRNLCRCGAHARIIAAVASVATQGGRR